MAFSADPGSAAATIQAILKWTAGANRDLHQQVTELLWQSCMLLLVRIRALPYAVVWQSAVKRSCCFLCAG